MPFCIRHFGQSNVCFERPRREKMLRERKAYGLGREFFTSHTNFPPTHLMREAFTDWAVKILFSFGVGVAWSASFCNSNWARCCSRHRQIHTLYIMIRPRQCDLSQTIHLTNVMTSRTGLSSSRDLVIFGTKLFNGSYLFRFCCPRLPRAHCQDLHKIEDISLISEH